MRLPSNSFCEFSLMRVFPQTKIRISRGPMYQKFRIILLLGLPKDNLDFFKNEMSKKDTMINQLKEKLQIADCQKTNSEMAKSSGNYNT